MIRPVLAALLVLGACAPPGPAPGPAPRPRYVVGEGYRLGGQWSYPREEPSLSQRGVAAILSAARGGELTANGERRDPAALVAAHRTLPLPSVVAVTNLENGRTLLLRVHDRGPEQAGRVIAVSPRAAELLGARGPFQAQVVVDAARSAAVAAGLDGAATPLRIAAAPVEAVARESLAPPGGARAAAGRPETPRVRPAAMDAPAPPAPAGLPGAATPGPAAPGRLFVEADTFFGAGLARAQAARLGFRAEPVGPPGRQQPWRVRGGPYASLAEADQAFARALAAGQGELRLVVE